MAVPCLTAVIIPLSLTSTTLFLLDLHTGGRLDETETDNLLCSFLYKRSEVNEMRTLGFLTVILQVVLVSFAFAVMMASPGLQAVIKPSSDTVAMLLLLDFQVISEWFDVVPVN